MNSSASYLIEQIGKHHWLVSVEAQDMIGSTAWSCKAHAWTRKGAHSKGRRLSDLLHAKIREEEPA